MKKDSAYLLDYPLFKNQKILSYARLAQQGYCNDNYLLTTDTHKYIVRKLLRDDIDRELEWQIHHLAYAQGITAEPLLFDRENKLMVFEFLEGEHKSKLSVEELKLLALTLQKLHSIRIDAKPIKLDTDTSTIDAYEKEYVLCHNDLNPKNIFFPVGWKTHPTKLIDFEYAGVNDRYFDLASVCVEFRLEGAMVEVFLNAYFKGEDFSLEKLEAYKMIYKALCEEWFQNML